MEVEIWDKSHVRPTGAVSSDWGNNLGG